MNYTEFRIDKLKAKGKKSFKISNSYGIKDAYRWGIKNNLIDRQITEKDFREIINACNSTLQDRLLEGKEVVFPERMGKLEIRKYNTFVGLEEGKIVTNMPVDWDSTLKLWFSDDESRKNKTLVRQDVEERFKVFYNKRNATYKNKTLYKFTPTRNIKTKLKETIKNGSLDAFLFERYELH